jgi:glycosyltransferase involved in cell wall biosynthesis
VRILWVKAGKLLPVDTGGKIRSYNLLKHLSSENDTTLLTYYDGPRDSSYEQQITQQFSAVAINTGLSQSKQGQVLNYLKCLPLSAPFAVSKFTSTQVKRRIREWDKEGKFDVLISDFLSASWNFDSSLKTPTVLFQHNVESALWQRQAKHEANAVKNIAFKLEASKMLKYETDAVKRFDHVIAVSDHDRDLMSKMTDREKISVVPTGVDLVEFAKEGSGDEIVEPIVLFLGSMDWPANVDGVDFFCREVWQQVKTAVPEAKFYIVGRNPPPRITKVASDSIIVTGRVESVMPFIRKAAVFIVPLRIGGGTRLKIYEAMAAGKAVVSTSVGAEGLDFHDGEDILIADEADKFASDVVELLVNKDRRIKLGGSAAKLAAQYDWATIAKRFEEILRKARS